MIQLRDHCPSAYDAIIIGGGLAGSTLACLLAEKNWSVLLLEKSSFPRNKPCGEFLSPAALPLLEKLGLAEKLFLSGGRRIDRLSIASGSSAAALTFPGARPGCALSRYALDQILLEEVMRRGGQVREESDVIQVRVEKQMCAVTARRGASEAIYHAPLVINASGRFNREYLPAANKGKASHKLCFKAHFKGPALGPEIKLVFFSRGYLGLCDIENGQVNIAGVAAKDFLRGSTDFDILLREIAAENTWFARWLTQAERKSAWFTCGPQNAEFRRAYSDRVFYAGDAAASVDPYLGQGMTQAMAGAFLLADFLLAPDFSTADPAPAGRKYEAALRKMHSRKLLLSKFIEYFTAGPARQRFAANTFQRYPETLNFLTRQAFL